MPIDKSLLDVVLPEESGYPEELAKGDTLEVLTDVCQSSGIIVTDFPTKMWIEPREWGDKAAQLKAERMRAIDYIDRFTNQGRGTNPLNGRKGYSTHECTCHSLRAGMEACWNRQRRLSLEGPTAGEPTAATANSHSVWLSPLSVYAEANPRERGGASIRGVVRIAGERGMLPEPIQPRDYKFKHTLHGTCGGGNHRQSSGDWVAVRNFPNGWQETAKHFRPREVIFPDNAEQVVCLLLHGYVVHVGRDGHAVPLCEWHDDDKAAGYPDSYNVTRFDSYSKIKRYAGGTFSIISGTQPDDYDNPANV